MAAFGSNIADMLKTRRMKSWALKLPGCRVDMVYAAEDGKGENSYLLVSHRSKLMSVSSPFPSPTIESEHGSISTRHKPCNLLLFNVFFRADYQITMYSPLQERTNRSEL
jgi:hypothetical protein